MATPLFDELPISSARTELPIGGGRVAPDRAICARGRVVEILDIEQR
jgi:hypothetical protein